MNPKIQPDPLRVHAGVNPDKAAVKAADDGRIVTYAELDAAADRISSLLQHFGLVPGQAVALLLENTPKVLEIWWGARRAGLYYVPLSSRLHPAELAHIVRDSGAVMLIASPALAHLATQVRVGRLLVLDEAIERLAREAAKEPLARAAVVGRELIYSSGTTGRPKGVKRALARAEEALALPELEKRIRALFGFTPESVYLSVSPLYHATGRFTMRIVEMGGTVVIQPSFDPAAALAVIEEHRVTHSQWVPTMFTRLLALPTDVRTRCDLTSHKVALHAAAPCPEPVKRAMIDWWGPILHEYYGGSENAGVTFIRAEEWLARPGSVGRSISGAIHILADDGSERELPPGEIGLIYFEGGVPFTYLNGDDTGTDARTRKGFSGYGDLGHVDEDGYLYISDRRSDLIISGGVNIYPKEIELILDSHPRVQESAVIGLADAEYGQRVHAVVATNPPGELGAEELLDFCRARLSKFKCPRGISFVEALPRNENGKIVKKDLRGRFGEQIGQPG
jgi:acyl-CoA synthetase (AMP-forming)/AMP-acid ligase II